VPDVLADFLNEYSYKFNDGSQFGQFNMFYKRLTLFCKNAVFLFFETAKIPLSVIRHLKKLPFKTTLPF
jgi:hypothetical protein